MRLLAILTWAAVGVGLAALLLQRWFVSRHRRPRTRVGARRPISVLKPLRGVDDGLADSIEQFARLAYPDWELLLGLESPEDEAAPIAAAAQRRWPGRVRVVLQQSTAGFNPKVNQLVTLASQARHDWLVVSDSNVRVGPDYLHEIADGFSDPQVACVAHPVSGGGHRTFGALLDNLHLGASIGPAQIFAKRFASRDLVIGKSMALRREALEALGGFRAFGDVLAEDYAIGKALTEDLGLRVALAPSPVFSWAERGTVSGFVSRYRRWGVIHRTAINLPTSLAQGLTNPFPLACLAFAFAPSLATAAAASFTFAIKAAFDLSAAAAMGCPISGIRAVLAVAVKDSLIFIAWLNGFFERKVLWRGRWLKVGPGSRLLSAPLPMDPAHETSH